MARKPVSTVPSRTLAAEAGISHTLVNRKRRQGKSDDQIRTEAQRRNSGDVAAPRDDDEESESYFKAQARKESAQADLKELELAERRGELIDAAEVTTAWAAHISAAKAKLLSMPDELMDKLAAEPSAIRCRELMLEKVRGALAELADA